MSQRPSAKNNRTGPQLMQASNAPLTLAVRTIRGQQRRRAPKRKRQTTRNQPRKRQALEQRRQYLSLCAAKYASALLDPEHTPVGACVPWGFPVATQKNKGFSARRVYVGTDGIGFALIRSPVANGDSGPLCTSYDAAGNSGTAFNAFTNSFNSAMNGLLASNSSYDSLNMSSRQVSQVVKVRYAGKEADRNGTVYCYENPTHNDIGNWTPSYIQAIQNRTSERPRMDGSWHTVLYSGPAHESEAECQDRQGSHVTTLGEYWGVIVIFGIAGDAYDMECYTQVEYAGSSLMNQGPAESDAQGYASVLGTIKNAAQGSPIVSDMARGLFNTLFRQSGGTLFEAAKMYGLSTAKAAFSQYLMSGQNTQLLTEL